MKQHIHAPPAIPWRKLLLIFGALFVMLSYFAIRAASGVGGPELWLVTLVQMLVLAAIVAPYVFAVVFLGGEDEHG